MNGELHIVVNQLMKVNDITEDEALNYINKSFDIWSKRSNFEWKLNTDYLKEYIK
jgi:hypothetical protein